MMFNRLVAFDMEPGVRPLGISEILRRLISKCVLLAVGKKATAACGTTNLSAGLPAGIDAAIHAVRGRAREEQVDDPHAPAPASAPSAASTPSTFAPASPPLPATPASS